MTREDRAREVLRDQFGDDLAKWVVRYGDPPAAVGTHHAIAAMLQFADAEAAAMRERAAETAIRYGDETVYEDEEYAAGEIAKLIRALPATGEVER